VEWWRWVWRERGCLEEERRKDSSNSLDLGRSGGGTRDWASAGAAVQG